MGGVVRVLLATGLLIAHAPVCKITAAHAVAASLHRTTHSPNFSAAKCKKPCCQGENPHTQPGKPIPGKPAKPDCPTNDPSCPLCAPLPGLVAPTAIAILTDIVLVDDLPIASHLLLADGFRTLLDRPPRA